MTLATIDDLENRLGRDYLLQVCKNRNENLQTIDEAFILSGLQGADAEIYGYIGDRLGCLQGEAPMILVEKAVAIAAYKLAYPVITVELKEEYDRSLQWLREVRDGRFDLQLGRKVEVSSQSVAVAEGPRVDFTRSFLWRT